MAEVISAIKAKVLLDGTARPLDGDVRALLHGADGVQPGHQRRYLLARAVDRQQRRAPQCVAVQGRAMDLLGKNSAYL